MLISSSRWRICLERATLLAVKSEAWSLMSSTSLCSGDSEALKLWTKRKIYHFDCRHIEDNTDNRTDGYLQLVPESVWVRVAVGEALLGDLGLAQLRQHGLQRGLEGVHLLKHRHGWFRSHHLQYLQRNWDIFIIRLTRTQNCSVLHKTSAWWDAREKTQLIQNISLLHSDIEFKV